MFDMMNLMGKMKELQSKMKEAQENLVNISTTGESGGGMVKVTVNGKRQITKIEVDHAMFKPEDFEMVNELIIAAANKALEEIENKIQEELKKSTQGILPNIPGFDLSNLGS
jgi:DNA-binding YbaB/EbfC family protein